MNSEPASPAAASESSDADPQSTGELQQALGDDFEVMRLLGRGSMATVYLAKERALRAQRARELRAREERAVAEAEQKARAAVEERWAR